MTTNFLRFLIFTLALVNSIVAQVTTTKSPSSLTSKTNSQARIDGRWYVFNAPDKDFVIEFPAKPKHELDSEAPSGTMRNYALDTAYMSFMLSYVDVGFEPTSPEGNQLPLTFRKNMLEQAHKRGWTVLRSELLRKNVYEQETWSSTKANPNLQLHYVERNIIRYGRQYVLTCSSRIRQRKVDVKLCRRFLDSFYVIREPQPQ